jgi:hypothetical protein
MNWCEVQRDWSRQQVVLRSYWPTLTDEDLRWIDGDRNRLAAVLQRRYSLSAESAEQLIDSFEKDVRYPGAVK